MSLGVLILCFKHNSLEYISNCYIVYSFLLHIIIPDSISCNISTICALVYLHLDNFIILLILKLTCSSFIH